MNFRTKATQKAMQVVWDPLLRIFHWSLVFFFFLAYLLEGGRIYMHSYAGYTVGLLLLFRLVWGFIGTPHALFSDFISSAESTTNYLLALVRGKAKRHLGHNPAGAAMIIMLLMCLSFSILSGMCLFAMEGSGPLANTFVANWPGPAVAKTHEFFANFTVVLVVFHVAGVLISSRLHSENLALAMISGKKRDA